MLSDYQKAFNVKSGQVPKLLETLLPKYSYVCHHRMLQFFVRQGLKVSRIIRVLKFRQEAFIQKYIDTNTALRQQAKSDFEKNFFKLLNNSCFGKTVENLRNRIYMVFVSNEDKAKFYTSKFNFKKFTIFSDHMVAISLGQPSITWSKPTYIGAAVLELSKLELYKFHYDQMVPIYGPNARVLYKDTDSLLYEIHTEDPYRDMENRKELFDLSDYPEHHFLHDKTNKKVPLKMTDELHGAILLEAVLLKSKSYSILFADDDTLQTKKSAKGVNRNVKNDLRHETYKNVLFTKEELRKTMKRLQSKKHEISLLEINKLVLSAYDDKRFILEDGITTLAHGHTNILHKRQSTAAEENATAEMNTEDYIVPTKRQRQQMLDSD